MQDYDLPKIVLAQSDQTLEHLRRDLRGKNISLTQFKYGLFKYYKLAVKNVYGAKDPQTWKSICLSCNMCRNLSSNISCCY